MIRGAIFDADGTLLDSMPMWSNVGSSYLRSFGIEPREDVDERFRDMSLYQSAVFLKNEYELPLSLDEIAVGINKMVDHLYAETVQMKPGVVAVLEGLRQRGVKMCVATATPRANAQMALSLHGLLDYFQFVTDDSENGIPKSKPEYYGIVTERLGVLPERTVMFEDSLYAMRAAMAAGLTPFGIEEKVHLPNADLMKDLRATAKIFVRDFDEAGEILFG